MTRGPRRLKDDPDFKWETGCDVADEGMLVGEYDLQGTRSRLLAAIALASPALGEAPADTLTNTMATVGDGMPVIRPGPTSSGWSGVAALKPLAVAVTGAFVVAASYWVGVQVGSDGSGFEGAGISEVPGLELTPVEAPAAMEMRGAETRSTETRSTETQGSQSEASLSPGSAAETPGELATATQIREAQVAPQVEKAIQRSVKKVASKSQSREPEVVATVAPELVAATQAAAVVEQLAASGTGEAPGDLGAGESASKPQRQSALRDQNKMIGDADFALAEGDNKRARDLYQRYLERFPKGAYRVEAKLGLLPALFELQDWAGAEAVARSIQDLPDVSGRRAEILTLRAESLVWLNRCEEALLLAGEIPSKAAAEVRRVCRRSGKETP